MPAMPRPKGKATDIAFSILGVPSNMKKEYNRKKYKNITGEYRNSYAEQK